MKAKHLLKIVMTGLFLIMLTGCGSKPVEIVDLDKVLEIMQSTLDELNNSVSKPETNNAGISAGDITPLAADQEDSAHNQLFVQRFAQNLSKANLTQDTIGVVMLADGAVQGFRDLNKNDVQDSGEASIFKIEIDTEGQRLIATDTQHNYRRSSGYRMGGGFFTGYFLASMFGRQHYSGIPRSQYSKMKMSQSNYRQKASTKSRTSARRSSGSRSFKSGK